MGQLSDRVWKNTNENFLVSRHRMKNAAIVAVAVCRM